MHKLAGMGRLLRAAIHTADHVRDAHQAVLTLEAITREPCSHARSGRLDLDGLLLAVHLLPGGRARAGRRIIPSLHPRTLAGYPVRAPWMHGLQLAVHLQPGGRVGARIFHAPHPRTLTEYPVRAP